MTYADFVCIHQFSRFTALKTQGNILHLWNLKKAEIESK